MTLWPKLYKLSDLCFITRIVGTGEASQQLSVLVALAEDLVSVHSTFVMAYIHLKLQFQEL